MTSISWLHVSDFHQGQPNAKQHDWLAVRDRFFGDLEYIHKNSGEWDAILFTGDIAFSGTAAEYAAAGRVIDDLRQYIQ